MIGGRFCHTFLTFSRPKNPDIVQAKLDQENSSPMPLPTSKALPVRVNNHETLVVYNHIQGYILDVLLKAVFSDAH